MSENKNPNKLDKLMKATYVIAAVAIVGTGFIGFKLWKMDSPAPEILKKLL